MEGTLTLFSFIGGEIVVNEFSFNGQKPIKFVLEAMSSLDVRVRIDMSTIAADELKMSYSTSMGV